mgnify:CR=1 FL=1
MSSIKLFQDKKIRSVWDETEQQWYFSVVDVVAALTDSVNPTDYLKKMRKRDASLAAYLGTNCPQVEMMTESGKRRKVLAANIKGLFRIIQSIPSSKAEPFKLWLAQVGYVADGIFKSQAEIDNHATQEGAGLGRIRWRDLDGNGVINEKDQQWIYNPTPAFSYGLNIYLEYKNFDLTMFWQGVQGVDVISDLKKETDLWSGLNIGFLNKGKRVLDAWTPTNPDSDIPALSRDDVNNEKRVSTYFVENGSFLKLRNLQIGYNVPQNFAKKMKMERLRLYLSAQNLLTIKSKEFTGVDPENPNYGYPIPLNLTFGINVSF